MRRTLERGSLSMPTRTWRQNCSLPDDAKSHSLMRETGAETFFRYIHGILKRLTHAATPGATVEGVEKMNEEKVI